MTCFLFLFHISDSGRDEDDDNHLEFQPKSNSTQSSKDEMSNMSLASNSTWQPRIQSMVMQNDGSIILCDNDSELAKRSRSIEVVEILSPTNYVSGKVKPGRHCPFTTLLNKRMFICSPTNV